MVLTDLDEKGEELAKKLVSYLEGYNCRVDAETRRELKRIARKDIKGIEDLYSLYLSPFLTPLGGIQIEEEKSCNAAPT